MCGVFGWYKRGGELSPLDLNMARAATETLAHRGPDGQGEWRDKEIYLGHRRLRIIDLSDAANQPFQTSEGVLAFNGEIYNYVELRGELQRLGRRFQTSSDTEVLSAALAVWGEDALQKLDGMFAGAWWDRRSRSLTLFRDPLGQKPLYFAAQDGEIVFASELRALLSLPGRTWTLDIGAFSRFMASGYYGWDETPVVEARKLLPGSLLVMKNGELATKRYWEDLPGDTQDIAQSDALDQLEDLLRQSHKRVMRSDVPVGVFFSGGIDSALTLDFCREQNRDVAAFTVAMSEPDFDESEKASIFSAHLGNVANTVFELDENGVSQCYADILQKIDEPHGDPGLINAYFLTRSARKSITVGIAGDGGDELFGGYLPLQGLELAKWMRLLPAWAVRSGEAVAGLLPASDRYLALQFKAKAYLQGFPSADECRLPIWLSSASPEQLRQLVPTAPEPAASRTNAPGGLFSTLESVFARARGRSSLQQSLHFYQQVFLPEFVCAHTDRAAMLSSLEVRSPLLAPDLIRFANRLPDRLKVRGGGSKLLLRRLAARRGYPQPIVNQAKQGFTFPIARWMKGSLKAFVVDAVADADPALFNSQEAQRLLCDHLAGVANNYRLLQNMTVFNAWQKRYPNVKIPAGQRRAP